LALYKEKWLLDLIAYIKYIVKYTEFLNYTGSDNSIDVLIFTSLALLHKLSSTTNLYLSG